MTDHDSDFRFAEVMSVAPPLPTTDGLIWKEAIRTGVWPVTPGPNAKPIKRPLVVKLDTDAPREVSLRKLVQSFRERAMDHVTIPLSHADRVDENTGFVEDVKIVTDPKRPGEYVLLAGHRYTEPDIREKVERGTIANNSVGILFDYVRKSDGRKFPQALAHIALTNKPWINGLKPFGVNASEMACFSLDGGEYAEQWKQAYRESLNLTSPGESGPLPGGKPGKHDNWVDEVGGLPRYIRQVARDLMEKGMPKSRAIAVAISQIKKWAVTSKDPKVKAKAIKAIAEWEAKKARSHAKSALNADELSPAEMATLSLSAAQALRKRREVNMSETTKTAEVEETTAVEEETPEIEDQTVEMSEKDNDTALELSEAKKRIRALEAKERARVIDDKIEEYGKTWGSHPALLKTVRDLMMADDGGPALLLSEEGEEKSLSATDVIDKIMEALPKPDVQLAEQARDVKGRFGAPPDHEEEADVEEKAKLAAQWLGDDKYLRTVRQ